MFWSRRTTSTSEAKALMARGAQLVDVRTKAEFKASSHRKTINIPLDELERRSKELDAARPVLLCCASGSRSSAGVAILKRKGFSEVVNIGAWQRVDSLLS
jgi:rhodanese-related sulfurtransferase